MENKNNIEFVLFCPEIKSQVLSIEQKCFSSRILYDSFDDYIQKDYFFGICAVENGIVCGYICANLLYDFAEIIDIAVDVSFRRMNIASKLLYKLIDECKQKNISSVVLEVASKNDGAIALYRKFGFKTDRIVKNYYKDPTDDALCMSVNV